MNFDEKMRLKYYPFDGDFGAPGDRIFSDKIVTGRATSKCVECLTPTKTGERVRVLSAIFDDGMRSYRWCSACCHMFSLAFSSTDAFDQAVQERNAVRVANTEKAAALLAHREAA